MTHESLPRFHVIIPARYGSTRFPGKPLAKIAGRQMVLRVVDQALRSGAASVAVATDDERIIDVVRKQELARVEAVRTRDDHPSGSDRVMEAAEKLALDQDSIVINVQGDEPLIPPEAIQQVATLLAQAPRVGAATLSEPISCAEDLFNPNVVKVVSDVHGRALYFSRAPIPHAREQFGQPGSPLPKLAETSVESGLWQRHIGIYGYRLATLAKFVTLPVATLEATESLEQLRLLANGISLAVAPSTVSMPGGIDTPEDLARVEALLSTPANP
ncbi:MAG: 3-deoxy-manno-octulosonate cytidylyltransferase [Pseudomonadales bacterium]